MPEAIPLAGAALGAVGSLVGNDGGSTTQQTTTTPWAPQGNAMQDLYGVARGVYDNRSAAGPYTGATYSGINGIQNNTANAAANWTVGGGDALAKGTSFTAGALQSGAPAFVNNAAATAANGTTGPAQNLYGWLPNYVAGNNQFNSGVDSGLAGDLGQAAQNGARMLGAFNSGLLNNAQAATADPTADLSRSAQTYANSGYAQDLMNATNADIRQTLGETTAGLNRQASAGGALNSSRAGMAEAAANRDAARLIAQSDASIGNNAFNTGLATAAQQRTSGLNTAASANTAGIGANTSLAEGEAGRQQAGSQFDTTSKLGAINTGLTQNLGYQNLDASTRLAGNAQLGTAANSGVNAGTAAGNIAAQNFSLGQGAGSIFQNDQNAGLQDLYAQWQRQNSYPQDILSPYAQIVQQGYNGASSSSSNGSATQPSNILGNILGGATAAQGLYNNFFSPTFSSATKNAAGGLG